MTVGVVTLVIPEWRTNSKEKKRKAIKKIILSRNDSTEITLDIDPQL